MSAGWCTLVHGRTHLPSLFPRCRARAPDGVTDCAGALVKGDRDRRRPPQVLCSFYPGEIVRAAPPGVAVSSALVWRPPMPALSPGNWSARPRRRKNNEARAPAAAH